MAIDYAYAHGTLIIASMADENSRHHNMPSAYNHVLPVHSMKLDGDISGSNATITTTSTTYLSYDTCSNPSRRQPGVSASAPVELLERGHGLVGRRASRACCSPEGLNQQP